MSDLLERTPDCYACADCRIRDNGDLWCYNLDSTIHPPKFGEAHREDCPLKEREDEDILGLVKLVEQFSETRNRIEENLNILEKLRSNKDKVLIVESNNPHIEFSLKGEAGNKIHTIALCQSDVEQLLQKKIVKDRSMKEGTKKEILDWYEKNNK